MNALHVSVTKMNATAFLVSHSLLLGLGKESGKTSSLRGAVLGAKAGKGVTYICRERVVGNLVMYIMVRRVATERLEQAQLIRSLG